MSDQEPIDLECPECKKKLRVPATAVGKRIRCPACSVVINVPAETGTTAEPAKARPKPPPEPKPDDDDEPVRDDESEDGDEDDVRKKPRRRRSSEDDEDDDISDIRSKRRRRPPASAGFMAAAICILLAAGLGFAVDLFGVIVAVVTPQQPIDPNAPEVVQQAQKMMQDMGPSAGIIVQGLFAVLSLVIIIGAVQMLRRKMWGLALTACILSMINLGNCCCFLGIPIGIWGMIMLLNQDVKDAFS